MNKRSCRIALLLAAMVSLMPTQPITGAYLVPNHHLESGLTAIGTLEIESLAELACLVGVITAVQVVRYLYLKRCFEQGREKNEYIPDKAPRI